MSFKNLIDFETGHLKLRHPQFDEDNPLKLTHLIPHSEGIETELDGLPYVVSHASRLIFQAECDNGQDTIPVAAFGIDKKNDSRVFTLFDFLEAGELKPGGALMGSNLASDLALSIGDFCYLTFRNDAGGCWIR